MNAGIIRVVRPDDLPEIVRLVSACGFPRRTVQGWHWVLFENPHQGRIDPGWVYERDGSLKGFLGNFVNRYQRAGGRYVIATGHTVVTDPSLKTERAGLKLIRHGLAQPDVDAFVTLNNNALSAPLLPRLGAPALLGKRGREWAEWIFRPDRVVRSMLSGGRDRERFDCASDFRFQLDGQSRDVAFLSPEAVTDQQLEAFVHQGPHVREISAEVLRYRTSDPDRAGGMNYVVAATRGDVFAVAALLLTKPSPERLDHAEIVDWAARDCDRGRRVQAELVRHLARAARRAGASKMRLHFPSRLPPSALAAAGPYLRRHHGHDPCHMQVRNPDLHGWMPGPGDADYFFAYRIPPALFVGA